MNRSKFKSVWLGMALLVPGIREAALSQDVFFVRSDANADGGVNLSDAVFTLNFLFAGTREPGCLRAADANDDGSVNISDASSTLGFLFLGTSPPPAPWPNCGHEATADDLYCGEYSACPQPVVPFEVTDGFAVVEGDIIIGTVGEIPLKQPGINSPQGGGASLGVRNTANLWPRGVIPFVIDQSLPNPKRITDAIAHWEQNTSIRFVAHTTEANFIQFSVGSDPNACSSFVGMQGGRQVLLFPAGCGVGQVIHEIGHAVGLWHEQSRCDRDSHLTVLTQNILPGREHNFEIRCPSTGLDIDDYDFGSIMHYGPTAFSRNGQPTIVA